MALSYNGWPASSNPDAIGINTAWEPIAGHRFPGGVKSGDVETVLTYFVRQLDARVEPIDRDAVKDEWGYAYRFSVNSPDKLSCHSSGTAFDYNATRHPNGMRGTWGAAKVAKIREIQAEVLGVVRWLGDATRVPDEMHFEIQGTAAEVAAVAARLRAHTSLPEDEDEMAVQRFELWRDSRNGHLYRIPFGDGSKTWLRTTNAKNVCYFRQGSKDEHPANSQTLWDWLDSIPTVAT